MERRSTFIAFFVGSALLHAALIAGFSVPPPSPLPSVQQVLVVLSPAPQPEPDPTAQPVTDMAPAPAPQREAPPEPPVEAEAIPDEDIPQIDLDNIITPIRPAPAPPDAQESIVTLPVVPTKTIPGDPTNESIVRAWLERNKRYPRMAVLGQIEGEVLLYLRLAPDGTVLRAAIQTSSTHDILDREVLKMVRRAEPFPLVPQTKLNTEYLIPIEFRLE